MQKLLMQRFSNKAKCDLLKWLPMVVHVFHKNRSDLFSERKKKQSAKSQQRSIGLKEKVLPKFQMKTIFD